MLKKKLQTLIDCSKLKLPILDRLYVWLVFNSTSSMHHSVCLFPAIECSLVVKISGHAFPIPFPKPGPKLGVCLFRSPNFPFCPRPSPNFWFCPCPNPCPEPLSKVLTFLWELFRIRLRNFYFIFVHVRNHVRDAQKSLARNHGRRCLLDRKMVHREWAKASIWKISSIIYSKSNLIRKWFASNILLNF